MRSFLIMCGLMLLAGILFAKGYLLRPAGAVGNQAGVGAGEIRFEYTKFEDEPTPAPASRPQAQPDQPAEPRQRERTPRSARKTAGAETPDGPGGDDVPATPAPHAEMGKERTIWVGDHEIKLDGSGSRGTGLTYTWRQVGGPVDLEIKDPHAAQTTATGIPEEWTPGHEPAYEFELTVRDVAGQESVKSVRYTVKAAPSISIVPAPKCQLSYREGYLLAHFEAWRTNRGDDAEAFEIRSPSELTFHQLSGTGEFEITVNERTGGFTYQLSVFYREGESTTYLEFFIDTPERIPAVLQFGVNWE